MICWFTREVEKAIHRNNFADHLFRGRRSRLLRHSFGFDAPGKFSGIDLAIKPEARVQFFEIGRGLSIALMIIVGSACAASAIGLARSAEWGRKLAIAVLTLNVIGYSLNALLRHDPNTLIGLPIGAFMIWYLLRRKRARI